MKTLYFKCKCCGEFEAMHNAKYLNKEDSENEENEVCRKCYAKSKDDWAYIESDGVFNSYEDLMEHYGVTIADDHKVCNMANYDREW